MPICGGNKLVEAKKEEPGREKIPRREENCPSAGEKDANRHRLEGKEREKIPRREEICPSAEENKPEEGKEGRAGIAGESPV